MPARELLTILYVSDLPRARAFYDAAFGWDRSVDVPVYVEYKVAPGARLGLMPQAHTSVFVGPLLGSRLPTDGSPRAEVYVSVDAAAEVVERLVSLGAECLQPLTARDWGDRAAYFLDLDGYVLAIAEPATSG